MSCLLESRNHRKISFEHFLYSVYTLYWQIDSKSRKRMHFLTSEALPYLHCQAIFSTEKVTFLCRIALSDFLLPTSDHCSSSRLTQLTSGRNLPHGFGLWDRKGYILKFRCGLSEWRRYKTCRLIMKKLQFP